MTPTRSYEEAQEVFKSKGWVPLFKRNDYSGWSHPLRVRCSCGEVWTKAPCLMLNSKGTCRDCRGVLLNKKSVTTRDGTFATVADAARFYDIPYGRLHARILKGWDPEVAVELTDRPPTPEHAKSRNYDAVGYVYLIRNLINGKVYIGLTSRTSRIRFKGHLINAFKKLNDSPLSVDMREFGVENFELKRLAKATVREIPDLERKFILKYKSNDSEFGYNRVAGGNLGGTGLGVRIKYRGKIFHSRKDFLNTHGIKYATGHQLFSKGLTPSQVLKEWLRRQELGQSGIVSIALGYEVKVRGVIYPSQRAACKALGLKHNTVYRRIAAGWSSEDSFQL